MAMTLYPAIDLLGGRCVRLRQGDYQQVQIFDADPLAVALRWQAAGAEWLHIVDLDGARDGVPAHLDVVGEIVTATGLPVQLGGGLRSEKAIAAAFERGVARVILGTSASRDPALLTASLARWGERMAVAVDACGNELAIAGWQEVDPASPLAFARRMARLGVATLVVTDVVRDGTLAGSDVSLLGEFRMALGAARLTAAGGLASIEDVRRVARLGIDGAVLGRALYAGAIDLSEALETVRDLTRATAEQEAKPC